MSNNREEIQVLKPLPKKVFTIGVILSVIGLVIGALAFVIDWHRGLYGYLFGFVFMISIAIGSLFFVALEYISGAVWSVPFRRIAEFFSSAVPMLIIFAVPLVLTAGTIFEWAHHDVVAHDPLLQHKEPYLNIPFFIIRVAVILLVWTVFYFVIIRNSQKQDVTADQKLTKKNIRISAIFVPVFAITVTVTAVDWIMSLAPHWISTIFGVYYFSGSLVAALAVITLAAIYLMDKGYLHKSTNKDHLYSLGALQFGMINFWAYIAFSQFMLIWYANLPETTFWYIYRWEGGWTFVSIALILLHFVVPYAMLLTQPSKKDPKRLKFISIWIIVAHMVDHYWLVMPSFHGETTCYLSYVLDFGFPVAVLGLFMIILYNRSKKSGFTPIGDPKLERAIHFRL